MIISVVYTKNKLSDVKSCCLKQYDFNCETPVEIGDFIESPMYKTPVQVVDIKTSHNSPYSLKTLKIYKINGMYIDEYLNTVKTMNTSMTKEPTSKKSIFSSFIEKYKSQFIPEKDEKLKLSMDGKICVPVGNEYIAIDKDNNLISYPEEMCMNVPVFVISKPFSEVKVGDIIKNAASYGKVTNKNTKGSISCISYSGYTQNKKEVKDFILNQSFVKVVVNMFEGINNSNFNPMILALADGNMDIKDMLIFQMMQGNSQLNPMLMLAMMDKDGGNSMLETMMIMQMMNNGNNPMFPINNETK